MPCQLGIILRVNTSSVIKGLPLLLIAGALLLAGFGFMNLKQASVDIEWETATELDTVGFNVYRSDSPNGELVKVNDGLIPASSEPLTGGKYHFIDRGAKPGTTYYYYLEDVDTNGVTDLNGPTVVKAAGTGPWGLLIACLLLAAGGYGFVIFTIPVLKRKENRP
jgi:hypothetical protein